MARFKRGNSAGAGNRWQPGQSGSPGGLPPIIRGVLLLAAQRAPRALHRLSELVKSTDDRIALAAAVALLDRAGVTPLEIEVQLGSRTPLLEDPLALVPEMDEAEMRQLALAVADVTAPVPAVGPPAAGEPAASPAADSSTA